ncbi:DUF5078 domain-containing protein [Mycobacterium sp. JS623]|uniref:DUF5078 domain-containing protein n=1 Tax=Mycobacterium sp. JS623 TaxID=212767 RepID=UPI000303C56A
MGCLTTVDQYIAAVRDVESVYYEQMVTHWGIWAKLLFNNCVAAHGTDICMNYPRPTNPGGTGNDLTQSS